MNKKGIIFMICIFIIGGIFGFFSGCVYEAYQQDKAWEELRITDTECEYSSQLEYEEAMMHSYEGYASAVS